MSLAHSVLLLSIVSLAVVGLADAASPTVVPISTPSGPIDMPVVGLGSAFGFTPPGSTNTTYDGTLSWLRSGGRSIHTAWMYCNQAAVGRAVRDFLAEQTAVTRADLFIESMLPPWHLGYNET